MCSAVLCFPHAIGFYSCAAEEAFVPEHVDFVVWLGFGEFVGEMI